MKDPVNPQIVKKFEDIERSPEVAKAIAEVKAKRELLPGIVPMTLEEMREKGFEPPVFSVDQLFLRHGINAVSGVPDSHKSYVIYEVIKCINLGVPFLDTFPTIQSKVLLIDEENGEGRVLTRFDSLTDENIGVYILCDEHIKIDKSGVVEGFIRFCHANDVETIVFDSLSSIHDAEENSNPQMTAVFENMLRLKQAGITVIFLHHEPKGSDTDPKKASLRGAGGILAKCDTHISFRHPANDVNTIIAKQLKNRDAERLPEFTIAVHREEDRTWFEYLGKVPEQVGKKQRTDKAIIELLTEDGELYQSQIIEALKGIKGIGGERMIPDRLTALVAAGKLNHRVDTNRNNRNYYSIKTGQTDE